jgi:hypothetical protein
MSGVVLFGLPRVTIVSIRRIHGGNAMTQANLTETLFKPRFKHPETSTLVRRFNPGTQPAVQSALDGKNVPHWYRMINRLMWIWRGIDPREILDVQARIVMSEAERTDSELYDTVVGYRGGNWIYEWSKQAMLWQQKASQEEDATRSGKHWLHAANLYAIAAYPHLKGDELAEQARRWRTAPMKRRLSVCRARCASLSSPFQVARPSPGSCICLKAKARSRPSSCAAGWIRCKLIITACMSVTSHQKGSRC